MLFNAHVAAPSLAVCLITAFRGFGQEKRFRTLDWGRANWLNEVFLSAKTTTFILRFITMCYWEKFQRFRRYLLPKFSE